jgi:hypothetical protein
MYRLPTPAIDSSETFNTTVAIIRSTAKRLPYEQAATAVRKHCENFDELAVSQRFDDARSDDFKVPELVDPEAMPKLYDNQFSQRPGTLHIRSSIRNAAPNDLCPYCGEGMVAELDHYLPKSGFSGITVHPANLVPACRDCNFAKKAYKPSQDNPSVLHPYFDSAFDIQWLNASIVQDKLGCPVVHFFVSLDQSDTKLEIRLKAHMKVFGLSERFSVRAAQSLDNFRAMLASDYGHGMTLEYARRHLRITAAQQSGGRLNSWEAAAHEAMLASDWYLIQYLGLQ